MAGTRRLSIEVVGDTKGVSKAFGEVDSAAGTMEAGVGAKMAGVGRAIAGVALGAAALGAAVVVGGAKLNTMGLELETLDVKAKTVFGSSLGRVESWADANAKAMGLTSTEAVSLATNMADLLKPMGFTADEAAGMSTKITDLSGALSAWTGGTKSAAEVSDIMTKAMLGETDGLKQLGISLRAAEVDAVLAAKGQSELTGEALAQAKALAVQQLILEKSTDAQTAWADGSMDSVKASNAQKAGLNELKETLVRTLYPAVQGLMPYLATATEWLGTNLPKAMAVIKQWVDANWPAIRDKIVEVLDFISKYVGGFIDTVQTLWDSWGATIMSQVMNVFEFIKGAISAALQVVRGVIDVVMGLIRGNWSQVWDGIKQIFFGVWDGMTNLLRYALRTIGLILDVAWEGVKRAVAAAWQAVVDSVRAQINAVVGFVTGIPARISSTISGLWTGIETGITTAKDWVKEKIDDVVGFATGLPGRLVGKFSGMWDGITAAFRSAVNFLIDEWNGLEFKIPGFDPPGPGPKFGGFTLGVPNIPRLHSGGTAGGMSFAGLRDDEVAAILQRGETVLTVGQTEALAAGGGSAMMAQMMRLTAAIERMGGGVTIHAANDPDAIVQRLATAQWMAGAR